MGFGFNLFFALILIPLTGILFLIWVLTKKNIFGKALGIIWIGVIVLVILSVTVQQLTDKKELEKKDYYGQYIVNRNYFSGKQADWQYEHFRFEIKDNDSIYFYVTNKEKIVKTYKGTVTTKKLYRSDRPVINMEQPTNHILTSNPTTYRSAWSFYLVFYSPKFNK